MTTNILASLESGCHAGKCREVAYCADLWYNGGLQINNVVPRRSYQLPEAWLHLIIMKGRCNGMTLPFFAQNFKSQSSNNPPATSNREEVAK